jgi:hypothetical protein
MTAKDIKREYYKQYREKNKDRIKETYKKWRDNNKDKVKQYNQNYWNKKALEVADDRG